MGFGFRGFDLLPVFELFGPPGGYVITQSELAAANLASSSPLEAAFLLSLMIRHEIAIVKKIDARILPTARRAVWVGVRKMILDC